MGIIIGIVLTLIIILGVLMYFFLFSSNSYNNGTPLRNPIEGLSDEQAVELFDESFVKYLLVNIGAGELRKNPLTGDTPKIELYVGDKIYSAEIIKGRVNVYVGEIEGEDIIINTPILEAIKMIRDKNYIKESVSLGKSEIEIVNSKTNLAIKGYVKIYTSLTGGEFKE